MITLEELDVTERAATSHFEGPSLERRTSNYWFKPKNYGWGFGVPIAWQGWIAWAGFLSLIIASYVVETHFFIKGIKESLRSDLRYFAEVFIITASFHIAIKNKIEGGLKWRWGNDRKEKTQAFSL